MKKNISLKVILIILLSSFLLGFVYNVFSSDGIDFIRKERLINIVEAVNLLNDSTNSVNGSIKGLKIEKVKELFFLNSAVFVDARDQWEFAENHIKGAINIPEFSFKKDNEVLTSFDKFQLFVIYCDGDDCDISIRLAEQFHKLGYLNSYVFIGGITEWIENKLPLSTGERL